MNGKECLWCGDSFNPAGNYYQLRGFCSTECYDAYIITIKINSTRHFENIPTKICVICGAVHTEKYEFCSGECSIKYCEMNKLLCQKVGVYLKCDCCGEYYEVDAHTRSLKLNSGYQFCSVDCRKKYMRGDKCSSYIDGKSIKYCSKWNDGLRTRVREFFGNKCFLCGKLQEEEDRAMSVHHVTYDKDACCTQKVALFVPLCMACHGKTNANRKQWETYFKRILKEKYNYKCYYTKEEYNNLKSEECSS